MKQTVLLITTLFAFANIFAQDCNLNEEARRYIARAKGYMAAAEKEEDYLDVFNEYKKALEYAPNCPDICYNLAHCAEILCKINTQNCDVAIYWYKKYLEINPNASDRTEIRDKIYEVEVKKEIYTKKERENALKELGKWIGKWVLGPSDNPANFEIYLANGTLKVKVSKKQNYYGSYNEIKEYQEIPVSIDDNNKVMTFSYVNRVDYIKDGRLKSWSELHRKLICRPISDDQMEVETQQVAYDEDGTRPDYGTWTSTSHYNKK